MSLYGALFSGVSGLSSQSSAMGAISDNISNVNTIGYKGTQVNFQTLVTHQVSSTEYSPGGVQSKPRAGIDVQGLLQGTTSSTDISLSGQGFFIVNSVSDPTLQGGQFAYTRAGSFKPDKNGYLQNASGFYLQGWPLTPTDNSPASVAGTININGNAYMRAYTNSDGSYHYINQNIVNPSELKAFNVNTIGGTAQATSNISVQANLPSGDAIYDPNNPSLGGIHTSNVLTYDSLGNTSSSQFQWTKTAANSWSLAVTPPSGAASVALTNYTVANGRQVYAAAGQVEFTSIPAAGSYFQMNGIKVQFYNSGIGGTDPTSDAGKVMGVDLNALTGTTALVSAIKNKIDSMCTNSTANPNISGAFLGGLADGNNRFQANANVLRINQEPGAGQVSIDCTSNATTGLGSSIVESGTGVGSNSATPGVFTVDAIYSGYSAITGTSQSFTVNNVPTSGNLVVGSVSMPWTSIVNGTAGSLGGSYTALPNTPATTANQVAANVASFMNQLIGAGKPLANYSAVTVTNGTVTLAATSSSAPVGVTLDNGGTISDFTWASGKGASSTVTFGTTGVYDSKTGSAMTFNGDGTPASIIPNTMEMRWANGAEDQTQASGSSSTKPWISLNFGSLNQSNGINQLSGSYSIGNITQNGAKFGNFSGVSIGADGIVTALFDNGVRAPVFQIPIATFSNPDGMSSLTGNVYQDTTTSGSYTVRQPGEAGSGQVSASSLEASTVDLGTEFTTMITVQRAYSASAKIITTADQMLDDLINIKR